MSKNPAIHRLILENNPLEFHRNKDKEVKVTYMDGTLLGLIMKDDWQKVADFFTEISHPESLL